MVIIGARETTSRDNTTATAPATAALSNADLENVVKAKIQSDDQLRAADIKVNADAERKKSPCPVR